MSVAQNQGAQQPAPPVVQPNPQPVGHAWLDWPPPGWVPPSDWVPTEPPTPSASAPTLRGPSPSLINTTTWTEQEQAVEEAGGWRLNDWLEGAQAFANTRAAWTAGWAAEQGQLANEQSGSGEGNGPEETGGSGQQVAEEGDAQDQEQSVPVLIEED